MLEEAFTKVKLTLTKPSILAIYDIAAEMKIPADASSHSLGAVLLQRQSSSPSEWKPVCYASRSLTTTEANYAQIEKETLASTWACERFKDYILGKHVSIETDHKPHVSLLTTKNADDLPPRILRFHLRLSCFDYSIHHVPGKNYTSPTSYPGQCLSSMILSHKIMMILISLQIQWLLPYQLHLIFFPDTVLLRSKIQSVHNLSHTAGKDGLLNILLALLCVHTGDLDTRCLLLMIFSSIISEFLYHLHCRRKPSLKYTMGI